MSREQRKKISSYLMDNKKQKFTCYSFSNSFFTISNSFSISFRRVRLSLMSVAPSLIFSKPFSTSTSSWLSNQRMMSWIFLRESPSDVFGIMISLFCNLLHFGGKTSLPQLYIEYITDFRLRGVFQDRIPFLDEAIAQTENPLRIVLEKPLFQGFECLRDPGRKELETLLQFLPRSLELAPLLAHVLERQRQVPGDILLALRYPFADEAQITEECLGVPIHVSLRV